MGVILTRDTTVLVQGITGREGSFWTKAMLESGTTIVAGVTPGKAGQMVCDLPVYDTVQQAVNAHRIEASVIYVPPAYAKDAAIEALASGIKIVLLLVDGLPVLDALEVRAFAKHQQAIVIGPNTPGMITVGQAMLGFIPFWLERVYQQGTVGFISRSGSLANEVSSHIVASGFGLSTFIGIGGDPAPCTRMVEIIKLFESDPDTEAIVMVGEIGGTMEEETAEYCLTHGFNKPLIAYIAGSSAPPGKKMGHAGAIIHGEKGSVKHKESMLQQAGAQIATSPAEIGIILKQCLDRS